MEWAEAKTAANTRITLFVAFNYGGRSEILDAARALHRAAARRSSAQLLYAPEMHDPDLLIRTSGEQRISNYLLWQAAYSRAALHRRAVARLLARGLRGGARQLRGARAPLRRPLDGRRPRARPREPRKTGTSDLLPRILVAIPAIAFAVADHLAGRVGLRARASARSAVSACTSCR